MVVALVHVSVWSLAYLVSTQVTGTITKDNVFKLYMFNPFCLKRRRGLKLRT